MGLRLRWPFGMASAVQGRSRTAVFRSGSWWHLGRFSAGGKHQQGDDSADLDSLEQFDDSVEMSTNRQLMLKIEPNFQKY